MKIGISTASLRGRAETEDAFGIIRETGAECCEVYLQTFYEYRPEFAKKVAPAICGLEVHSVHVSPANFEPQLFDDSRRIRGDGFYWLDQIMRSCQLLGAKNYAFNGIIRTGENDDFDAFAAYIRGAIEFCGRYGVRLCLENAHWSLYNRPKVFGELKRRCPQLCGAFDLRQAQKSGYPYSMYLRDMSGAISLAHLSDVDENGNICLPGQGVLNFEEVFKRLQDCGFDGAAIIEAENLSDIKDLKNSVEFLKEIVYRIN